MANYLFVHFTGETEDRESIWFSVSKDGLHFSDLGGDKPLLESHIGTGGIRDPFMVHDETLGKYFLLATDLKTAPGGDWEQYSHNGSRSILIWESQDLIHWSPERLVPLGVEKAGCCWAPEAVYCRERGEWLVFFASLVEEKQRIFASFTKDFRTFGETFEFINKPMHIIDTSICWDKGYYYRFSKDETAKGILIERSANLLSEHYETLYCKALDGWFGVEGPEIYHLEDSDQWCLIVDQYRGNKGYRPLITKDLTKADFRILEDSEFDFGPRKKRHGGVIQISDEEYARLINEDRKENL